MTLGHSPGLCKRGQGPGFSTDSRDLYKLYLMKFLSWNLIETGPVVSEMTLETNVDIQIHERTMRMGNPSSSLVSNVRSMG